MTRARLSDETLSGAPADGDEGGDGGAKHRSKSMAKMREEQQARAPPEGKDGRTPHTPRAHHHHTPPPDRPPPLLPSSLQARLAAVRRAAAEAQMLGDFIRLADYMTVSCCYLLTLSTAERLLELLSTPRKTGLWITTVEFGKSGMAFTPPQAHFMGSLQSLLEGMINNIHAVPRLLYMRPFKPYFPDVAKLVGPDVARLVREADAFQAAQERIEQVVLEDFERATTYAQQFEEYRVIHCFGEHWSFDAYAERQQTATFKESVVAFKQDMAQV